MSEKSTKSQETVLDRHDGHHCWRCGVSMFSIYGNGVILGNVFTAMLCNDCRNDWEVYAKEHPVWIAMTATHDQLYMTISKCADGKDRADELEALRATERGLRAELFAIAKTWTADVIERPVPAPPPPPTEDELKEMRERRKKRLQVQLAMMDREEQEQKR